MLSACSIYKILQKGRGNTRNAGEVYFVDIRFAKGGGGGVLTVHSHTFAKI